MCCCCVTTQMRRDCLYLVCYDQSAIMILSTFPNRHFAKERHVIRNDVMWFRLCFILLTSERLKTSQAIFIFLRYLPSFFGSQWSVYQIFAEQCHVYVSMCVKVISLSQTYCKSMCESSQWDLLVRLVTLHKGPNRKGQVNTASVLN